MRTHALIGVCLLTIACGGDSHAAQQPRGQGSRNPDNLQLPENLQGVAEKAERSRAVRPRGSSTAGLKAGRKGPAKLERGAQTKQAAGGTRAKAGEAPAAASERPKPNAPAAR